MESGALSPLGAALALLGTTLILLLPRRTAMLPIFASVCFLPDRAIAAGGRSQLLSVPLGAARGSRTRTDPGRSEGRQLVSTGHPGVLLGDCLHRPRYGVARSWTRPSPDGPALQRARAATSSLVACCGTGGTSSCRSGSSRVILVPLVAAMLYEKATGRNVFAVLGGVSEMTLIREGKLRAQGAFQHPILAGTFGATVLPLMVGLMRMKDRGLRRDRSPRHRLLRLRSLGSSQQWRAPRGHREHWRHAPVAHASLDASRAAGLRRSLAGSPIGDVAARVVDLRQQLET